MKRKYNVNDNFFDKIDSEQQAYLLGFFIADGSFNLGERCKNSYRFQIGLQDTDEEIIKLYQKFICPDVEIKTTNYQKGAKNRKPVKLIRWTSTYMAEVLINNYNIIPNKTKDLNFEFPFELIPKKYLWDFIRGFFDGDGQFSYNETTHQSTFAMYATSKKWANQIANIFEGTYNVEKRIEGIQKSKMILYTIRFSANQNRGEFLLNLYRNFYSGKKYFLCRKEQKLRSYLMFKYRVNQQDFERLVDNVERS